MKKLLLMFALCSVYLLSVSQKTHQVFGKKWATAPSQMGVNKNTMSNIMQRLDSVHNTMGSDVIYSEGYWYDVNQVSLGYYSMEWNAGTNAMDTTSKEMYSYNANNQIQQILVWNFDGAALSLFSRTQMSYDANGNVTQETEDLWDMNINNWSPNQQVQRTFNGQDQAITEITQYWDFGNNQWVDGTRITNSYSTSGIVNSLSEYYDATANTWIPSSQTQYTYSPEGWLVMDVSQYFDDVMGIWVPNAMVEYTYTSSGQQESALSSYYDTGFEVFTPISLVNFIYDGAGNNIQQVVTDPNDPFNPQYRQNFVYDNTYAYGDLILPYYVIQDIPEYFTHKLLNLSIETWDGVQWVLENNADLFYSQQTVIGISENTDRHEVMLFPNPAVSHLTIKTNGVNQSALLLDAQGRCIQRQNITGTEQVDISHLSNGVYHWIINGKSYTFVK